MKRYTTTNYPHHLRERDDGEWVDYEDAAAIERENAELRAERSALLLRVEQSESAVEAGENECAELRAELAALERDAEAEYQNVKTALLDVVAELAALRKQIAEAPVEAIVAGNDYDGCPFAYRNEERPTMLPEGTELIARPKA